MGAVPARGRAVAGVHALPHSGFGGIRVRPPPRPRHRVPPRRAVARHRPRPRDLHELQGGVLAVLGCVSLVGPAWVRERDYFFVVSFKVWGVFAAFGLVLLVRWFSQVSSARAGLAVASFLALVPFAANFKAASRRHGPDATAARDFAYNLVQSVEPYGVLFAYGDNDTFPVWYLQEVEGIRQDVTLINLSLANL